MYSGLYRISIVNPEGRVERSFLHYYADGDPEPELMTRGEQSRCCDLVHTPETEVIEAPKRRHSPLPWQYQAITDCNPPCTVLCDADGRQVAIVEDRLSPSEFAANRDFILTAVNSYAAMRDALEGCIKYFDTYARHMHDGELYEQAKTALALAGKEAE